MRRTRTDLVVVLNTIVPCAGLTVFCGVLVLVFPGLSVHWPVWGWMIGFSMMLFLAWLFFRRLF
jgi:hypothetical protein